MSNSSASNMSCPISPYIHDIPEEGRTLGLVLTIGICSYLLILLGIMYRFHRQVHFRHRENSLTAISFLGITFLVLCTAFREFYGRDEFPCDIYLWLIMSIVPLLCGPLLVRLMQFKNKMIWQDKLKTIPLDPTRELGYGNLLAVKYKASKRNSYRSMALLVSFFMVIILGYFLINPTYGAGCLGCGLGTPEIALFAASIVGVGVTIAWELHKIRELIKDHATMTSNLIVTELRNIGVEFSITMVFWAVLFKADPGGLQQQGYFTWSYLLVISGVWYVTYTVPFQVYKSLRVSSEGNNKITLLQVIKDPELVDIFEAFLKSEFSFENLRFWLEATRWKASYPGDHVEEREMADWRREGVGIYETFVRRNAVMQVNLPSKTFVELMNIFDEMSNQVSSQRFPSLQKQSSRQLLPKERESERSLELCERFVDIKPSTFDSAINDVYHLMEQDSFGRFLRSKEFKSSKAAVSAIQPRSNLSSHADKQSRKDTGAVSTVGEEAV